MKGYQYNILISWILIAIMFGDWLIGDIQNSLIKVLIIIAALVRFHPFEKERLKKMAQQTGLLVKSGFAWMFCWLIYILSNYIWYHGSDGKPLSDTQMILFMSPIVIVFIIADIKWFFKCNEKYKT